MTTTEARLLVVDDEPNIRELLATSLRFAGFEIHTAADGASALRLAREVLPDLVLLDVMLPDMDGFTVTTRMREKGQTMPVLFLTAKDAVEDRVAGLTAGGPAPSDRGGACGEARLSRRAPSRRR